jgi:hypothetical protein
VKCTACCRRQVVSHSASYSPIERTPGANAFVLALDCVLGPTASRIKRGEHSFNAPEELRDLLTRPAVSSVAVLWAAIGSQSARPSCSGLKARRAT